MELNQSDKRIVQIPLSKIIAGTNDRTKFSETALKELAASIGSSGLLQPITVRAMSNGTYEIIAGERRFRAHQFLTAETIEAIILDADDERASTLMLTENIGREDLSPIDEARAYASRMKGFQWDVKKLSEITGKGSIHIAFRLKLLNLSDHLQSLVHTSQFPIGYAQILADFKLDENRQLIALRELKANTNPTSGFFRKVCNRLLEEQAQEAFFEGEDFMLEAAPETFLGPSSTKFDPADPLRDKPVIGKCKTPAEYLALSIAFWNQAKVEWTALGKIFKVQQCDAAIAALQTAMEALA